MALRPPAAEYTTSPALASMAKTCARKTRYYAH